MSFSAALSYCAAYFGLTVAVAVLFRDWRSLVHRVFAAGMLLLAAEELLRGISQNAVLPGDVIYWQKRLIAVSACIPAFWLAFSLSYARVNPEAFLSRWKWGLLGVAIAPLAFLAAFRQSIFEGYVLLIGPARWLIPFATEGKILEAFTLSAAVLILFNLERTIRSSIGRMRWQIKFMALGVGGLFCLRLYLASQSLLYGNLDTGFGAINAIALLAACALFGVSLSRGRTLNVDVYLSTATIQNSLTIVLSGIYLVAVGVLARFARYASPSGSLPLDAFIVFAALTLLAILLLSNRLRLKIRMFVSRHFRRPVYDYRNVWMDLTERTKSLLDVQELSTAVSRMVSESLEILSVSVWLVDETFRKVTLGGSTALSEIDNRWIEKAGKSAPDFINFFRKNAGQNSSCIDLDRHDFSWPKQIMAAAPEFFSEHRMRYAIGLHAGGELVGIMTLNDDRVGQQSLSAEDFVLLETLATQLSASLLNLKLSGRLRHAKELETFQTVSTFFVHDLKNLASRLSLTMQNLPGNFDSPEFRADTLRVMSTSLDQIDEMCSRLAMLRQNIELKLMTCDLSQLVASTLQDFQVGLKSELKQDLKPLPSIRVDSEQIQKVLTNLVMNAKEAVGGKGTIEVATIHEENTVGFLVRDNGCGMSEEFIQKSLFRPFKTTKKKGLGIGLFHSKLIIEAHHGTFEVNSTVGSGTEFRVLLPA
jgi:putative PEP-CTERM system histidine kinase